MRPPAPASAPRQKIAFIKRGRFSEINPALRRQLEECFPEYDVVEVDVGLDLLKKHRHVLLFNWLWTFAIYGWAMLRHRRPIGMSFYYTPYIARAIRRLLLAHFQASVSECAFSFATQSLYNAKLPGLPHFIYTDHTHLANLRAPGFNRAFLAIPRWIELEREVYHDADDIFVMGENARTSLIEDYRCDASRVQCVYGGRNTSSTPPALDNDGYRNQTVAFVGLDWERKGGPELLAAFTEVARNLPNARLHIVGASPVISHPQVQVIGRVPVEEISSHLARASVFCLPSRYEPFGIAVLEAFAQKIPAVVTQVGALQYLVQDGETGRVVPQGNVAALARALEELLRDPEKCRRYGETAALLAEERYTWRAVGKRIRQGIVETLAKKATA